MQYHETGLPQDQTVYKAFMMFTKNQALPTTPSPRKDMRAAEGASEGPLRIAQILSNAGNNDPQLLSLALLRGMPQQTFSLIEKSFGADMVATIREATKHNMTQYAYVSEASDKVKLVSLATAMVTFEQFTREAEKTQEMIAKMSEEGGQKPGGSPLMIPIVPDMRVYDKLSAALYDKTSSPALEQQFREKLSEFRYANDRLKGMLIESGIADQLPPAMAMRLQQPDDTGPQPSFSETELLDDPKVRAAFDVLSSHPGVSAEAFEAAVAVGTILTKTQSGLNSTAVASGLLLTGLRDVTSNDLEFLKKKLDWDVLELLKNYGGERDLYPQQLRTAPEEFKQFLLANTVAMLDRMKQGAAQMKDIIAQQPDMPEEVRPMVLSQNLGQMLFMTEHMEDTVATLGPTGAPQLEEQFRKALKETRATISENMPQQQRTLPPGFGTRKPPPPKPPTGGQNFDLD